MQYICTACIGGTDDLPIRITQTIRIEPSPQSGLSGLGQKVIFMRIFINLIWAAVILLVTFKAGFASDKIAVFVSILPQKYFVEQIGKDRVEVQVMVQPGASPHAYEPKPTQMAALSKASLYFAAGVPFERVWLKKFAAANPEMVVIHSDRDIKKMFMIGHHHGEENAHEAAGTHAHGQSEHDANQQAHAAPDPHIWLSPPLVKIQSRTITDALQSTDPDHKDLYEDHFRRFAAEIDRLDAHLKKAFAGKTGLRFMVFHPSWGYFAQAYGLEQIAIEIEGKDPKPAQLKMLIQNAREKGIRVIFVQPQFSTKSAALVAKSIGGRVVFADPLAEDWMTNLYDLADTFRAALK
jgi:zinc transport system substrate-binding protein